MSGDPYARFERAAALARARYLAWRLRRALLRAVREGVR